MNQKQMNPHLSHQRWLYQNYDQSSPLTAQFFKIDKFLRSFPRVQLETNEYLVTSYRGHWILARRMTGFIDQLSEGLQTMDLSCKSGPSEAVELASLEQALKAAPTGSEDFQPLYVITGEENKVEGQLKITVQQRHFYVV